MARARSEAPIRGNLLMGLRPMAPEGDRFDPDRVGLDHLSFEVASRDDAHHTLPFYPNAITLSPAATAAETGAGEHRPYSVKDSFARLDLAPAGLRPLFDADWIARAPAPARPLEDDLSWDAVTSAGQLAQWETAWAGGHPGPAPLFRPELLADPSCAILARRRAGIIIAGAIAYTAGEVTGISNVFSAELPAGPLWASALQAVAALRPGLPVVGYERAADLAAARQAGCHVLGPLRVWACAA